MVQVVILDMTINTLLPAALEWYMNGLISSPVLYTDAQEIEAIMSFQEDKYGFLTLRDSRFFRLACPQVSESKTLVYAFSTNLQICN